METPPSLDSPQQCRSTLVDGKGLESPKLTYEDRVDSVIVAWEKLSLSDNSNQILEKCADIVHRDTLELVLQGEWPSLPVESKTQLEDLVKRCADLFANHPSAPKYHSLTKLLGEPWGHPALKRILDCDAASIDDNEVITFCNSETSSLLVMRLDVLTSSKCEDIALKLARICVRCLKLPGSNLQTDCPVEHRNKIIDYFVALLYKFKLYSEIIERVLKDLSLAEGLELVERHSNLSPSDSRLWKKNYKIALLEAHYLVKTGIVKKESVKNPVMTPLIKLWICLHKKSETSLSALASILKQMVLATKVSHHIYNLCNILGEELEDDVKPVIIELFIHALTLDLNGCEEIKLEKDTENTKIAEISLSDGFLHLANVLSDNICISRECVLTAFTLNPTQENYVKVAAIAATCQEIKLKSEKEVIEDDPVVCANCLKESDSLNNIESSDVLPCSDVVRMECDSTTPNSQSETYCSQEQSIVCPKCGSFCPVKIKDSNLCDSPTESSAFDLANYDILSAANHVLVPSKLGISQQLCDDLYTMLKTSRWQVLHWLLDWNVLKSKCEDIVKDPNSRLKVRELKHLKPDFSQQTPLAPLEVDEFYGIEEGYEHMLDADCLEKPEIVDKTASKTTPSKSRKKNKVTDKEYLPTKVLKGKKKKVNKRAILVDTSESSNELPSNNGTKSKPKSGIGKKSKKLFQQATKSLFSPRNSFLKVTEKIKKSSKEDNYVASRICKKAASSNTESEDPKLDKMAMVNSVRCKGVLQCLRLNRPSRTPQVVSTSSEDSGDSTGPSPANRDSSSVPPKVQLNPGDAGPSDKTDLSQTSTAQTGLSDILIPSSPSTNISAVPASTTQTGTNCSMSETARKMSSFESFLTNFPPHEQSSTSARNSMDLETPKLAGVTTSKPDDTGSKTLQALRNFRPSERESPKKIINNAPSLSDINLHPKILLPKMLNVSSRSDVYISGGTQIKIVNNDSDKNPKSNEPKTSVLEKITYIKPQPQTMIQASTSREGTSSQSSDTSSQVPKSTSGSSSSATGVQATTQRVEPTIAILDSSAVTSLPFSTQRATVQRYPGKKIVSKFAAVATVPGKQRDDGNVPVSIKKNYSQNRFATNYTFIRGPVSCNETNRTAAGASVILEGVLTSGKQPSSLELPQFNQVFGKTSPEAGQPATVKTTQATPPAPVTVPKKTYISTILVPTAGPGAQSNLPTRGFYFSKEKGVPLTEEDVRRLRASAPRFEDLYRLRTNVPRFAATVGALRRPDTSEGQHPRKDTRESKVATHEDKAKTSTNDPTKLTILGTTITTPILNSRSIGAMHSSMSNSDLKLLHSSGGSHVLRIPVVKKHRPGPQSTQTSLNHLQHPSLPPMNCIPSSVSGSSTPAPVVKQLSVPTPKQNLIGDQQILQAAINSLNYNPSSVSSTPALSSISKSSNAPIPTTIGRTIQTVQQPATNTSSPSLNADLNEQLMEFESILQQHIQAGQSDNEPARVETTEPVTKQTPQFITPSFGSELLSLLASSSTINRVTATPAREMLSFVTQAGGVAGTTKIPLVVVTSYSQPMIASPAITVTSQSLSLGRQSGTTIRFPQNNTIPLLTVTSYAIVSSPVLSATSLTNSSPSSTGKTIAKTNISSNKPSTTVFKPKEDEDTVQRIYSILGEYAEKLRNTSDVKSKPVSVRSNRASGKTQLPLNVKNTPAPRRRSKPNDTRTTQPLALKKLCRPKYRFPDQISDASGDDIPVDGSEDSLTGITIQHQKSSVTQQSFKTVSSENSSSDVPMSVPINEAVEANPTVLTTEQMEGSSGKVPPLLAPVPDLSDKPKPDTVETENTESCPSELSTNVPATVTESTVVTEKLNESSSEIIPSVTSSPQQPPVPQSAKPESETQSNENTEHNCSEVSMSVVSVNVTAEANATAVTRESDTSFYGTEPHQLETTPTTVPDDSESSPKQILHRPEPESHSSMSVPVNEALEPTVVTENNDEMEDSKICSSSHPLSPEPQLSVEVENTGSETSVSATVESTVVSEKLEEREDSSSEIPPPVTSSHQQSPDPQPVKPKTDKNENAESSCREVSTSVPVTVTIAANSIVTGNSYSSEDKITPLPPSPHQIPHQLEDTQRTEPDTTESSVLVAANAIVVMGKTHECDDSSNGMTLFASSSRQNSPPVQEDPPRTEPDNTESCPSEVSMSEPEGMSDDEEDSSHQNSPVCHQLQHPEPDPVNSFISVPVNETAMSGSLVGSENSLSVTAPLVSCHHNSPVPEPNSTQIISSDICVSEPVIPSVVVEKYNEIEDGCSDMSGDIVEPDKNVNSFNEISTTVPLNETVRVDLTVVTTKGDKCEESSDKIPPTVTTHLKSPEHCQPEESEPDNSECSEFISSEVSMNVPVDVNPTVVTEKCDKMEDSCSELDSLDLSYHQKSPATHEKDETAENCSSELSTSVPVNVTESTVVTEKPDEREVSSSEIAALTTSSHLQSPVPEPTEPETDTQSDKNENIEHSASEVYEESVPVNVCVEANLTVVTNKLDGSEVSSSETTPLVASSHQTPNQSEDPPRTETDNTESCSSEVSTSLPVNITAAANPILMAEREERGNEDSGVEPPASLSDQQSPVPHLSGSTEPDNMEIVSSEVPLNVTAAANPIVETEREERGNEDSGVAPLVSLSDQQSPVAHLSEGTEPDNMEIVSSEVSTSLPVNIAAAHPLVVTEREEKINGDNCDEVTPLVSLSQQQSPVSHLSEGTEPENMEIVSSGVSTSLPVNITVASIVVTEGEEEINGDSCDEVTPLETLQSPVPHLSGPGNTEIVSSDMPLNVTATANPVVVTELTGKLDEGKDTLSGIYNVTSPPPQSPVPHSVEPVLKTTESDKNEITDGSIEVSGPSTAIPTNLTALASATFTSTTSDSSEDSNVAPPESTSHQVPRQSVDPELDKGECDDTEVCSGEPVNVTGEHDDSSSDMAPLELSSNNTSPAPHESGKPTSDTADNAENCSSELSTSVPGTVTESTVVTEKLDGTGDSSSEIAAPVMFSHQQSPVPQPATPQTDSQADEKENTENSSSEVPMSVDETVSVAIENHDKMEDISSEMISPALSAHQKSPVSYESGECEPETTESVSGELSMSVPANVTESTVVKDMPVEIEDGSSEIAVPVTSFHRESPVPQSEDNAEPDKNENTENSSSEVSPSVPVSVIVEADTTKATTESEDSRVSSPVISSRQLSPVNQTVPDTQEPDSTESCSSEVSVSMQVSDNPSVVSGIPDKRRESSDEKTPLVSSPEQKSPEPLQSGEPVCDQNTESSSSEAVAVNPIVVTGKPIENSLVKITPSESSPHHTSLVPDITDHCSNEVAVGVTPNPVVEAGADDSSPLELPSHQTSQSGDTSSTVEPDKNENTASDESLSVAANPTVLTVSPGGSEIASPPSSSHSIDLPITVDHDKIEITESSHSEVMPQMISDADSPTIVTGTPDEQEHSSSEVAPVSSSHRKSPVPPSVDPEIDKNESVSSEISTSVPLIVTMSPSSTVVREKPSDDSLSGISPAASCHQNSTVPQSGENCASEVSETMTLKISANPTEVRGILDENSDSSSEIASVSPHHKSQSEVSTSTKEPDKNENTNKCSIEGSTAIPENVTEPTEVSGKLVEVHSPKTLHSVSPSPDTVPCVLSSTKTVHSIPSTTTVSCETSSKTASCTPNPKTVPYVSTTTVPCSSQSPKTEPSVLPSPTTVTSAPPNPKTLPCLLPIPTTLPRILPNTIRQVFLGRVDSVPGQQVMRGSKLIRVVSGNASPSMLTALPVHTVKALQGNNSSLVVQQLYSINNLPANIQLMNPNTLRQVTLPVGVISPHSSTRTTTIPVQTVSVTPDGDIEPQQSIPVMPSTSSVTITRSVGHQNNKRAVTSMSALNLEDKYRHDSSFEIKTEVKIENDESSDVSTQLWQEEESRLSKKPRLELGGGGRSKGHADKMPSSIKVGGSSMVHLRASRGKRPVRSQSSGIVNVSHQPSVCSSSAESSPTSSEPSKQTGTGHMSQPSFSSTTGPAPSSGRVSQQAVIGPDGTRMTMKEERITPPPSCDLNERQESCEKSSSNVKTTTASVTKARKCEPDYPNIPRLCDLQRLVELSPYYDGKTLHQNVFKPSASSSVDSSASSSRPPSPDTLPATSKKAATQTKAQEIVPTTNTSPPHTTTIINSPESKLLSSGPTPLTYSNRKRKSRGDSPTKAKQELEIKRKQKEKMKSLLKKCKDVCVDAPRPNDLFLETLLVKTHPLYRSESDPSCSRNTDLSFDLTSTDSTHSDSVEKLSEPGLTSSSRTRKKVSNLKVNVLRSGDINSSKILPSSSNKTSISTSTSAAGPSKSPSLSTTDQIKCQPEKKVKKMPQLLLITKKRDAKNENKGSRKRNSEEFEQQLESKRRYSSRTSSSLSGETTNDEDNKLNSSSDSNGSASSCKTPPTPPSEPKSVVETELTRRSSRKREPVKKNCSCCSGTLDHNQKRTNKKSTNKKSTSKGGQSSLKKRK